MPAAPATSAGEAGVRVTVTAGARRVDVRLPDGVPVAELVPALADRLRLSSATTGALRLITTDGHELAPATGLADQAVADGAVLGLVEERPRAGEQRYDDLAEAVADSVTRTQPTWTPPAARRAGLAVAAAAGLLGLAGLAAGPWTPLTGALGAAVAVGCLLTVRTIGRGAASVVLLAAGSGYAATAALAATLTWLGGPLTGWPWAVAGAIALGYAATGAGWLRDPAAALPALGAATVAATAGVLVDLAGLDPARIHAVALVLVVLAQSGFGWLALAASGTDAEQWLSVADPETPRTPIDPARVRSRIAAAHRMLAAATLGVGAVLVLTVPFAVSLGPAGVGLAVAGSAVVLLRTRHLHSGRVVAAGLTTGLAGLSATAVVVLVLYPGWRPAVVGGAVLVAAGLHAWARLGPRPSLRGARAADLAEGALVLALLPLLAVAAGPLEAVLG